MATPMYRQTAEDLRQWIEPGELPLGDRLVREPELRERDPAAGLGAGATFSTPPSTGRVAVLELTRTAFDRSTMPFRLTVTVAPAARHQFIVDARAVPASQDQPTSPGRNSRPRPPGLPTDNLVISTAEKKGGKWTN
jgi:hypothetical protein